MLGREQIQALVPHAGTMCLWDEVRAWDAQRIVLAAGNHCDLNHPLRRDGQLAAVHLCEYGAQAMAVHGGLLAQERGRPPRAGLLVSLRDVRLRVARIDDLAGELLGHAEPLVVSEASQQYAFRIFHRDRLLAEGRAAVILQAEIPQ